MLKSEIQAVQICNAECAATMDNLDLRLTPCKAKTKKKHLCKETSKIKCLALEHNSDLLITIPTPSLLYYRVSNSITVVFFLIQFSVQVTQLTFSEAAVMVSPQKWHCCGR